MMMMIDDDYSIDTVNVNFYSSIILKKILYVNKVKKWLQTLYFNLWLVNHEALWVSFHNISWLVLKAHLKIKITKSKLIIKELLEIWIEND